MLSLASFCLIVFFSTNSLRLDKQQSFDKNAFYWDLTHSEVEIPEGLVEIKVDTVMSNDFRVQIHNQTSSERIHYLESKPNKLVKKIYKGFESDLMVYYQSSLVFEKHLDKHFFRQGDDSPFWDKAILQSMEVDQLNSIEKPLISIRFYNPELNAFKAYQISVDKLGTYKIHHREDSQFS